MPSIYAIARSRTVQTVQLKPKPKRVRTKEYKESNNKSCRAYWQKMKQDPEWLAKYHERQKRKRERRKADPVRWQNYLQRCRESKARCRMRNAKC